MNLWLGLTGWFLSCVFATLWVLSQIVINKATQQAHEIHEIIKEKFS